MRNLLAAHFSRMGRNRYFWITLAASFLIAFLSMMMAVKQCISYPEFMDQRTFDDFFLETIPFLGFLWAAFSSLFLGAEYSDGTIRNKLIAGHSRPAVYLSGFILTASAGSLTLAASLLGSMTGLFYFGSIQMGWTNFLLLVLVLLLTACSLSALLTALQMNLSNRAVSVVLSFALVGVLLYTAASVYNALCQPEIISGLEVTAEGMKMREPSPNPDYISGAARDIYSAFLLVNPLGQHILMANGKMAHPFFAALASLGVSALATAIGLPLFSRKNIK